ncbi:MAG: hypothetical protein ACP5EP_11465 [Acidobacteriaceae bacterium]
MPTEPREILCRCFGVGEGHAFPTSRVFSFISASNSVCCKKFMAAMQMISPSDLERLSFEAMCVYARVSPMELLGEILVAAKSLKGTESALKAILSHPEVVQSTIDSANLPGAAGTADRKMMHEALGFLPTKKGGVQINMGFGRPPEDRTEGDESEEAWDACFPSLGAQVSEWSVSKHKLLEEVK